MRVFLGLLCGVGAGVGAWIASAAAALALWGTGNDGGLGMAAVFQVGPLGGGLGFAAGLLLFLNHSRRAGEKPSAPDPRRLETPGGTSP